MPTGYAAHTAHCRMGAANKVAGMETDKIFYLKHERQAVYTAIPSTFCTGRVLHSLIANKMGYKYEGTWVH